MLLLHKLHIRLIDFRRRDAVADDVDEEKFLRPRMSYFCEAFQAGALAVDTGEEDGAAFRKVFEDACKKANIYRKAKAQRLPFHNGQCPAFFLFLPPQVGLEQKKMK